MSVSAPPPSPPVVYCIDADDRITWVNEAWDPQAVAFETPAIHSGIVIVTVLWRYVSDPTLRHLLQRLFGKVRETRAPLVLSCRCDAPDLRRNVRVLLESADGAAIRITNSLVAETARDPLPGTTARPAMLKTCGWCNAFEVGGRWVEIEAAIEALQLLRVPHYPLITHGLFAGCAATLREAGS